MFVVYNNTLIKESILSNAQPADADTLAFVARQLLLQGITLSPADLSHTTHHYTLLLGHAERVMGLPLDEHIEPAPVFHPGDESSGQ
ncbi:hypothetical protein ACJ67_03710 [Methylophilus sp. TWE2]|nr:hypothetical protein ACJ67_03710 [Methylophilus sp. TWE2]